jgi:hypothetical protein
MDHNSIQENLAIYSDFEVLLTKRPDLALFPMAISNSLKVYHSNSLSNLPPSPVYDHSLHHTSPNIDLTQYLIRLVALFCFSHAI